ncbi:UBN2_3 domain-containing protein, partial [Cephalotus follicularis]
SLQISSTKFNGTNYLPWSKACMLSIRATKLVGYLTGTTPRPKTGNGEKWLCEDALVMSWLLNSIEPTLSPHKQVRELKQGELPLATYYSTLTYLWQQFDSYRTHKPSIAAELLTYQKNIEKERVYAFLGGLNPEYDPIRVQVLGKEPFPTLREAHNLVQHEETHHNAIFLLSSICFLNNLDLLLLASSSTNGSHSGTSNLAQSGIISSVYNVSSLPSSSEWCLDSGANEHMTSSSEVFDSYTP